MYPLSRRDQDSRVDLVPARRHDERHREPRHGLENRDALSSANAAGAPLGRPFGGLFQPERGDVFRTQDGELQGAAVESSRWISWDIRELNSGLARAVSDPTGLLMTKTEQTATTVLSRHIFYVGTTAMFTSCAASMVKPGPIPTSRKPFQARSSQRAGANPTAYAFLGQNTLHVVYRGTDDCIQELWGFPGSWNHNPVGAPFTKA